MDEKYLQYLHKQLQETIDGCVQALASGAAADYPAYRELCGRLRGLRDAQQEINDLVQKLKDSDNE